MIYEHLRGKWPKWHLAIAYAKHVLEKFYNLNESQSLLLMYKLLTQRSGIIRTINGAVLPVHVQSQRREWKKQTLQKKKSSLFLTSDSLSLTDSEDIHNKICTENSLSRPVLLASGYYWIVHNISIIK